MKTEKFKSFWKPSFIFLLICLFCFAALAVTDPNPDSPVPVLLSSSTDSTRVLAVNGGNFNARLPQTSETIFYPGERSVITLFVTNLALIPGEGANAFRVYLGNQNGNIYELQTLEIQPVSRTIYALRIRLFEAANYRDQPPANGDALIFLSWRGLASNVLKIGLGSTDGNLSIPEPLKLADIKTETESPNLVGYYHSGDRKRFMEQATFGPTAALDMRIRRIGLRIWLTEQFDAPYPTIPYPNIPLMQTTPPTNCTEASFPSCYRQHYTQMPLQQWFFKEAFYGNAQLRHRVSWALSQILVTSGVQIQQSSHMIAYHKVLSENAFGNYRKLLKDITLNPAMGDYLDTVRSTRNNPNENYPREILQLFSTGLFELNLDGTVRTQNGNPIPTYDQEDINNFSKVFTGWSFCNQGCPSSVIGLVNYKDPLIIVPANHDTTEKTLLNYPGAPYQTIPPCSNCDTTQTKAYAEQSLEQALDNIYNHPNVAPFISKLLIQQLVMSDPSPYYVESVATVFNQHRTSPTQLKEVVKAILLHPEARGNIKTAPRYGKLREPVQMATNLARLFPAMNFYNNAPSDGMVSFYTARMGQNPFYSPTVFNYYSPDYIIPGTTILAPEFELMNTGMGINRINFVYTMVFWGIQPNATDTLQGTSLVLDEAINLAYADPSGNQMMDFLNQKMMHGTMTQQQRTAILNAVLAVPATSPVPRAKTAVYLIAASSQYQIQR